MWSVLFSSKKTTYFLTGPHWVVNQSRRKPDQYFIQRHVFAMLDEMLEWFAQLQNL